MSSTDEYNLQGIIEDLEAQLQIEKDNVTHARETAHEQATRAVERERELRNNHSEAMDTLRERWQAESNTKQARIDELLATDAGQAWAEVEDMKRQVTRAEELAERYRGRMTQAESDRDRALASVAGGENIHAHDPRVAHIWRKASSFATKAGYCSEYDRLADALGIPEVEYDYSGYVGVRLSAYVSVPVSGTATRRQIADGDVADAIDISDIMSEVDQSAVDWEVDEVDVQADDDE